MKVWYTVFMLKLPTTDDILHAISQTPLGVGAEARVFKVHTNPNFTVRVADRQWDWEELYDAVQESAIIPDSSIFGHRNFGQTVAHLTHPKLSENDAPLLTVNLYSPGFSYEIIKDGSPVPDSETALRMTQLLSRMILNIPGETLDGIVDDLHFLNAKRYSIDVGGGLFTNLGNILYSAVDKRLFIIDLQPFIYNRVGIPQNHTKGFNTPLYLARGLLPGTHKYQFEHASDNKLIYYRTEILDNVISACERNHLSDIGSYAGIDRPEKMIAPWKFQLKCLHIPEKYHDNMIARLLNIQDEPRYAVEKDIPLMRRISGKEIGSY